MEELAECKGCRMVFVGIINMDAKIDAQLMLSTTISQLYLSKFHNKVEKRIEEYANDVVRANLGFHGSFLDIMAISAIAGKFRCKMQNYLILQGMLCDLM